MGQSVRLNIGLCHNYESVELENVSVAMAMIIPGFNKYVSSVVIATRVVEQVRQTWQP